MSGGGASQTQKSQNGVAQWMLPYMQDNTANTAALEQTGQLNGTSMPVAGLSSLQQQGLNSISGINPTSIGAADSSLTNTLGGGFMGAANSQMSAASPAIAQEASGSLMNPASNPYLQQSYNLGLQGIQNNVDSQFGAAGRNVLAGAPVQADQASNLATQLYGGAYNTSLGATQNAQQLASGNYNTGVGQINQAAGLSPGVTSGLYTPGTTQLGAGQTQQTTQQNQLNAPYSTLSWYSGLLGGQAAPFSASSAQSQINPGLMGNISSIFGDIGQII